MLRTAVAPFRAPFSRTFFLIASALLLGFAPKAAAQCALVCKQNLLVSLSPSGDAPITWQMVAPTAGAQCPGPLELTLFNEQGVKLPDDTLRCAHIGQDMVAEVKHLPSGNRCTGTVQVRDALSPQLMCPEKMIFCLEDSSPAGLGT